MGTRADPPPLSGAQPSRRRGGPVAGNLSLAKSLREPCLRSGSILPDKDDPHEVAIAGCRK